MIRAYSASNRSKEVQEAGMSARFNEAFNARARDRTPESGLRGARGSNDPKEKGKGPNPARKVQDGWQSRMAVGVW
jgi:hypothetical protein